MSARPPYYRTPGGGRPSVHRDAATFQLAKRAQGPSAAAPRVQLVPVQTLATRGGASAAVSAADSLQFDGATLSLDPATPEQGGWIRTTGDLGGIGDAPTVAGLQGRPVDASAPATGDVLEWNGNAWAPASAAAGSAVVANLYAADRTLDATDQVAVFDESSLSRTASLPPASGYAGPTLTIKNRTGTHLVVVHPSTGDTIDDAPGDINLSSTGQWLELAVRADGAGWWIVGQG